MIGKRRTIAGAAILTLCLCASFLIISCEGFGPKTPIASPVNIPGAEYVGLDVCTTCHDKQAAEFRGAVHSHFAVTRGEQGEKGKSPTGEGCESCHGPGSLHIAGRGDTSKIIRSDWRTCVACHLEKRASFQARFHHPVPEGRMSCTACHDPHKGIRPVNRAETLNNTCFECHPAIRGPWTFPHAVVEEDGCTACHDPHGTNQNKMLVANTANLCLRCHFDFSTHPAVGGFSHVGGSYLLRGCENCHRAMHGSNFSPALRHE